MAKHPTEFVQPNLGMDWFRQIAEHNLRQGRASLEEFLGFTRKMVDDFGSQASAICEHSMSLSEETISNAFDYGAKLVRVREPLELPQVQIDLVSRQAQMIADHTKELNQRLMEAAEELPSTAAESARRQSKAA
jgi:Phasin protein